MTKSFPIGCVPISGHFQAGTFIINGYVTTATMPTSTPTMITDQQLMHHGTKCTTPLLITAQVIWDGQAILATDGSVKHEIITYTSWIISTTNDNIEQDIAGRGLLPPSAPYAHHASKQPEAAALYAALQWIANLLKWYPNNMSNAGTTPTLPFPINNKSVIDDIVHHPVMDLTPTFQLLTPNFDITQAIQMLIPTLPIKVDIFHVKVHQDHDKPFNDLSPFAQINILADCYVEQLY